jgi:hypothetical protein
LRIFLENQTIESIHLQNNAQLVPPLEIFIDNFLCAIWIPIYWYVTCSDRMTNNWDIMQKPSNDDVRLCRGVNQVFFLFLYVLLFPLAWGFYKYPYCVNRLRDRDFIDFWRLFPCNSMVKVAYTGGEIEKLPP